MCDFANGHQHGRHEQWVTPADSQRLSSKLVTLFPGDGVPEHTTGPGREEVIIVLYGSIEAVVNGTKLERVSGETLFIAENTPHSIRNQGEDPAQYCYCVTKKGQHAL
jgi:quercetin dioxygenase-like cupin family protein